MAIVEQTRKVVLGVTTGVATVKQATVMRQLSYNPATSNAWRIVDALCNYPAMMWTTF